VALLDVRASRVHGSGLFVTRPIAAGTRVGEYTGERITEAEARRRYDHTRDPSPQTYLFAAGDGAVIDGLAGGNETRFINHSCEPNCRAVRQAGRVFVEVLRDLPAGAELFLDYALRGSAPATADDRARFACRCGAPTCRGTMIGDTG